MAQGLRKRCVLSPFLFFNISFATVFLVALQQFSEEMSTSGAVGESWP